MQKQNGETILVIVPCAKQKIWDKNSDAGPTLAKDAYISPYFRLCRSFAESYGDSWIILSAKYGLIPPDFIILKNYDISLKSNLRLLEKKLTEQVVKLRVDKFDCIIFLGGKVYHKQLEEALRCLNISFCNPLLGLPIGKRMKMLKGELGTSKIFAKAKSRNCARVQYVS